MTRSQNSEGTAAASKLRILPLVVGGAFILGTWVVHFVRSGTIYVSINGFLMAAVFGFLLPSDEAKLASIVFPIVQAWLVVLLLRNTESKFVWIVVMLFLALITIPFFGYAKMG